MTCFFSQSRWRFWVSDVSAKGGRRQVSRSTKAAIRTAAEMSLEKKQHGQDWLGRLSKPRMEFLRRVNELVELEEESQVVNLLAAREKSVTLANVIERFLAEKLAGYDGVMVHHYKALAMDLKPLKKSMGDLKMSVISTDDLADWHKARLGDAGKTRYKAIRATLVTLWRWANRHEMISQVVTVADRIPAVKIGGGNLEIFQLDEIPFLLKSVGENMPLRGWLVMGLVFGLRPEEISPKSNNPKKAILAEHLDFNFRVLRVPKGVAGKHGPARVIPFPAMAEEWLQWAGIRSGMAGRICDKNPSDVGWLAPLAKKLGWKKCKPDVCRHSYASYRIAVTQSFSQVSNEMGNSESQLKRHYNDPRSQDEGVQYFTSDFGGILVGRKKREALKKA